MKRIAIVGVNSLNEPVKLSKDVRSFTDAKQYFKVTLNADSITITTPKGVYNLSKHPTLNIYNGVCSGHKVNVSIKKIAGEIRFW